MLRCGLLLLPFAQVVQELARQPGADERALLMFFLPPVLAALFLAADNGHFDRTIIRGAWLLIAVNAVVSALAEIDVLPIQPQFPGALPARIDRLVVLHLAGWYSFVLLVCPGWLLCSRVAAVRRSGESVGWCFVGGWLGYATGIGILAAAAGCKLF